MPRRIAQLLVVPFAQLGLNEGQTEVPVERFLGRCREKGAIATEKTVVEAEAMFARACAELLRVPAGAGVPHEPRAHLIGGDDEERRGAADGRHPHHGGGAVEHRGHHRKRAEPREDVRVVGGGDAGEERGVADVRGKASQASDAME